MNTDIGNITIIKFITPFNIVLFLIFIYLLYSRFKSKQNISAFTPVKPEVFQDFTPKTLERFNGKETYKIFISIKGNVYDVTSEKRLYGPEGPYRNFAGKDASRGLAKGSFDINMIMSPDEPIDKLLDLTDEERNTLDDWEKHFQRKYEVVGKLIENI
ncbi:unnamed protein product [Pneumocystis jirovecii]|uniref:Cytochrome b5 heme-binding domain-containing protein n=2 Tax=Pneumocystis jirovecii TaxID=42068 RepID=L0PEK0_PNEJI|nr:uncharacterized protein T551_01036 [Pneumocystis jirovecii RU7]KTW31775.1 hypothetical protein T551_01036 [Pneumocystis jirovecii RU7]CCJ30793.1 unnamed protein product [Pneumocystis jirovecii]